jgi:hypothetical protein
MVSKIFKIRASSIFFNHLKFRKKKKTRPPKYLAEKSLFYLPGHENWVNYLPQLSKSYNLLPYHGYKRFLKVGLSFSIKIKSYKSILR